MLHSFVFFPLSLALLVAYVMLFIKVWQMTIDVKNINNRLEISLNPKKNFKYSFYALLAAGNKEKAKKLLFKQIENNSEFRSIIDGRSGNFAQRDSDTINEKFRTYMKAVDMEDIDFTQFTDK